MLFLDIEDAEISCSSLSSFACGYKWGDQWMYSVHSKMFNDCIVYLEINKCLIITHPCR